MVHLPDFKQIWIFSTDYHERPQYQFDGNPSIWSHADTCGQPDKPTDMTKLKRTFPNYVNTRKS
jgi:hypothetical protein